MNQKETMFFGRYMQAGIGAEYNEPIEWIVLEEKQGIAKLISKKGLHTSGYWLGHPNNAYKDNGSGLIWENSAIREWLNTGFYNIAFNAEEQEKIQETKIKTVEASYASFIYSKVFLLSEEEVLKYFPKHEDRLAEATQFALDAGANVDTTTNNCFWWILTEQNNDLMQPYPKVVYPNGQIHYHSRNVAHNDFVIRPVIRVKVADLNKRRIPLDNQNIYYLTVYEYGSKIDKISIDKELAEDSHYELEEHEARKLYETLVQTTGAKTLEKCLEAFFKNNSDIALVSLMKASHIEFKQIHFY